MAFLDKRNVKIFYEVYGDTAPLVVLINGHTRSSSDFKQFANYLVAQSYQVLVFDNRGSGQTESDASFSLEDIAEDLNHIMTFLGFKEGHLFGFSMGGIIARVFAHKYPEKVKTLGLVSSPSDKSFLDGKNSSSSWGSSEEEIEKKLSFYIAPLFYERNKVLIKAMAKGIFSQLEGGFAQRSLSQRKAVLDTQDHFFSIQDVKKNILIFHGSLDLVIPLKSAHILAESSPNTSLFLFKEAGHLLLLEKNRELYKEIVRGLKESQ